MLWQSPFFCAFLEILGFLHGRPATLHFEWPPDFVLCSRWTGVAHCLGVCSFGLWNCTKAYEILLIAGACHLAFTRWEDSLHFLRFCRHSPKILKISLILCFVRWWETRIEGTCWNYWCWWWPHWPLGQDVGVGMICLLQSLLAKNILATIIKRKGRASSRERD